MTLLAQKYKIYTSRLRLCHKPYQYALAVSTKLDSYPTDISLQLHAFSVISHRIEKLLMHNGAYCMCHRTHKKLVKFSTGTDDSELTD